MLSTIALFGDIDTLLRGLNGDMSRIGTSVFRQSAKSIGRRRHGIQHQRSLKRCRTINGCPTLLVESLQMFQDPT
jgi:hypothetical protein